MSQKKCNETTPPAIVGRLDAKGSGNSLEVTGDERLDLVLADQKGTCHEK
jgi:hypothetical protein